MVLQVGELSALSDPLRLTTMAVRVTLAGRVGVEAADGSVEEGALGRPARAAFAFLVCERHRPVRRDELAEAVWGEEPPRSWEQLLRGIAGKIRAVLAGAGLEPDRALTVAFGSYQLHLGAVAVVDVEEAAAAVDAAEAALEAGDADTASTLAAGAVAVARSEFLPGAMGVWVERRQAEVHELHLRGLEALAAASCAQRRWSAALGAAEEAVALEPFRESAYLRLMAAHAGAGNRGDALRAYERCRRTLAEELGVSPSPPTEAAYVALLGAEPSEPVTPNDRGSRIPLPSALAAVAGSFLVGRDKETRRLTLAFERASTEGRQAVLVAGEPGIGKTALVSAVARQAHASRARVLYGRCDEELGVPYQPFAEALGHYVAHCSLAELEAHTCDHGSDLVRLVPDLVKRLPGLAPPPVTDPEADRFRLFETVAALLASASQVEPLVVVLEDVHWAANATLLLIRHLLRGSSQAAVMIVATYRHSEVSSSHPLAATLADLRREPGIDRIRLEGLDAESVAAFVEAAGTAPGDNDALAQALHAHTSGNPFFLGELLRYLTETGGVYRRDGQWSYYDDAEGLGVPEGVRDVVARRLHRLGAACNEALLVASVIGAEFQLSVVEGVLASRERGVILDAIEEAETSQLVAELAPGRYMFSHAVVRHTIYSGLTATRRARLHRQVGEMLEAMPGAADGPGMAALADHFAEAATAGCASKAADYALAAARHAIAQAAWEDAALRLEHGLDALEADEAAELERRCDLLLLLAETWTRFFDPSRTLDAATRAVDAARALGSPKHLAWAAHWYIRAAGGLRTDDHHVIDQAARLAEEALAILGDKEPALRARILSHLVSVQHRQGPVAKSMAAEAVALARRADDADALGSALAVRCETLRGSPHPREHLAAAEELVSAAPPGGWEGWRNGHSQRALARLALGDRPGFEADVAACQRLGDERRFWFFSWSAAMWRAGLALLDGRFGEVEALAAEARRIAPASHLGKEVWLRQLFKLRSEHGDLKGAQAAAAELVEEWPDNPLHVSMLAFADAELHGVDVARSDLLRFADAGLGPMSTERWPVTLAYRAEVGVALGGEERARALYDALAPWEGQLVIGGMGDGCMGAVDRYLGMLAAAMGRRPEAEEHYQAALALEAGVASPPLVARSRYWYGRMLRGGDEAGDAERAEDLLAASLETAERLGMSRLATEVREVLSTPPGVTR